MQELINISGIIEYELPVPAVSEVGYFITISLFVIILLCLIGYLIWRIYFSKRGKAILQLKKILFQLQNSEIRGQNVAFETALIFKNVTGISYLNISNQLPNSLLRANMSKNKQRWVNYINMMSQARYTEHSCDNNKLISIISETQFWLKYWPIK